MPDPLFNALMSHEQQDRLKEHYQNAHQNRGLWSTGEADNPTVAPPSWFQPDPLVVGTPLQAQITKRLLDLDPAVKARTKDVTFGPTHGTMNMMSVSNLPIDRFGGTSLLGVTENKGRVGISPDITQPSDILDVASHELGHVAGWGEGGAQRAEQITGGTFDERHNNNLAAGLEAIVKRLQGLK